MGSVDCLPGAARQDARIDTEIVRDQKQFGRTTAAAAAAVAVFAAFDLPDCMVRNQRRQGRA